MIGVGKEKLDAQAACASVYVPADTWNSVDQVDDTAEEPHDVAEEPLDADETIAKLATSADRGHASLQLAVDGSTSSTESASSLAAAEEVDYIKRFGRECDQRHQKPQKNAYGSGDSNTLAV